MATHSLDTFISTLQAEVARAQARIADQQRERVQRSFEAAGPPGRELLALRRWVMPRVAGFSLEVNVELKMSRRRGRSRPRRMVLVLGAPPDLEHRRLRITLTGAQPGDGEVWLDDVPLRIGRLRAITRPPPGSFRRLPRRPINWRSGAIRLRLSDEDSRRLDGPARAPAAGC